MRLGILGGTFDPIHSGHLAMARAAASTGRLDRVLLVPCARPPHKEHPDLTGPYHRFAMAALAALEEPYLAVSEAELRRGGVSYTVETLRDLAARSEGDDLHLVMGSDSFAEIATWRSYREILSLAAVLVIPRPGTDRTALLGRLTTEMASILRGPEEAGSGGRGKLPFAALVGCDPVDVSSTDIRNRVREGRNIGGMVPRSVETYIRRQGLYGAHLAAD